MGRHTPTTVHVDPLGRPFLEQRAMSSAKDAHGTYTDTTDVHLTLDLQGNPTAIAAQYEGTSTRVSQLATTDVFDLLGRSLRHVRRDAQTLNPTTEQAEGGATWQLPAVDGQPVRTWDSRDHATRLTYDALRRPTATFLTQGANPETCPLFTRYGEQAEPDPADAQARRLFGHPWRVYDTAGLHTTVSVDPMGHVTETTRKHVATYNALPDWSDHAAEPDPTDDPLHDPA